MRHFLHIDEATRELRLVTIDLWMGQHERTEWRVVDSDRRPLVGVERWKEWDGMHVASTVTGVSQRPRYFVAPRSVVHPSLAFESDRVYLDVEDRAVGPTEKIPCRRAANPRTRRCDLCRAEERIVEEANARRRRAGS